MDEESTPREGELTEGLADPRAPWEELVEDPAAQRALLAVLFTDIVGSTELATALGDQRWRELLEQHDAAIRRQIARYSGREVDTAGDAFFATFELPVRAVDCALESIRAVRRLGLQIRAGVHMGECTVSDGKVRGVSVHIGARVGAKAVGGELLVSSTVRDVLAGAGIGFRDRGEQTLKGVDGRWRLYAVEPRTRDDDADLPPLLEPDAPPPVPFWKRRRTVVAGVTALVLAVAATTFAVTRGGGLSSVPADSIAIIDAGSGNVTSTTPVGRRPVGLAVKDGGVWVANSVDRTVSRVSPGGRVDTIGPLGASPSIIAAGADLLWIGNEDDGSVSRVSPATKAVVGAPIRTGNGLSGVAFGARGVWITNAVDGTVWRLDPASGKPNLTVKVGPALRGIIANDTAVWTVSEIAGTVSRIDPALGAIVTVIQVGNGPRSLALGAGALWVANAFDGTVSRIDPEEGEVTATIRVGADPRSIAIAKGKVFVANESDASVSVIDPGSNKVTQTIKLKNAPMGLTADDDRVWVSVRGGILAYRGGTLRFGNPFGYASLDPMHSWNPAGFAITTAAYDGLLSFKRVGGVEGSVVLPDLAEELVPPTDEGKTYTFRLRKSLRYSSGAAVKASDVRKTFERMFRGSGRGDIFFGGIVGSDACNEKACDLSQGVVTDDGSRTIVFHLKTPVPEFPYFLANPLAVIVPPDTPVEDAGFTPIPGTGPYRIAKVDAPGEPDEEGFVEAGEATLERNPYFTPRGLAQPDGYPDRIVYTWGGEPQEHLDALKAGTEDTSIEAVFAVERQEELANSLPGQFHVFEMPFVRFLTLNPNVPPYNDVRVRQAINYAVDRRAMAEAIGAPLTADVACQMVPPGIIGHIPYCPYTKNPGPSGLWTGPDLERARQLVAASGTVGKRIRLTVDPEHPLAPVMDVLSRALKSLGYKVVIEHLPGDEIFDTALDSPTQYQTIMSGWFADFPAPSNFLLPTLACTDFADRVIGRDNSTANVSFFCDHALDQKILTAIAAQEKDLLGSADEWAAVDRAYVDAAAFLPYATQRITTVVSARAGNVLSNPMTGLLLTQMWLTDRK